LPFLKEAAFAPSPEKDPGEGDYPGRYDLLIDLQAMQRTTRNELRDGLTELMSKFKDRAVPSIFYKLGEALQHFETVLDEVKDEVKVNPEDHGIFKSAGQFSVPRSVYIDRRNPTLKQVDPQGTDLEIYTFETGEGAGRPAAIGWQGKGDKPLFHNTYLSVSDREKRVQSWIDGRKRELQEKSQKSMDRKNYTHSLVLGDILSGSWGYDQTNVDFYEVVAVPTAKSVRVRKVQSKIVREDGHGSVYVVPDKGNYDGPPALKIVSLQGTVKIDETLRVTKWDGNPERATAFGWGH
jgi:hypothetical protein